MQFSEGTSANGGDLLSYTDLFLLSDERVMQEVRGGNADAFAVVFKRYHRLVQVVALRILRDAAEAEDVTQTVFLEIFRNAVQFDSARGELKVWLLQYAYSRSTNRLNYLLVRRLHDHTDVSEVDQARDFWSPARLQCQESSRLSREALACLSLSQRQTMEMFFFEGLSHKEIAERTGDSYAKVRHHYYRGLEQIRSFFELLTPKRTRPRRREEISLCDERLDRVQTR